MTASKIVAAAASGVGGAGLDVDEVFSTFLYTGDGSGRGIVNNIDLLGEGGLVWTKERGASGDNNLIDTVRGANKRIRSDQTGAESTRSNSITSFENDGYNLSTDAAWNNSGDTFVSWTWRKAPKFFDVVTWTGSNFGGGRQISHNLGSVPGMIIIKRTSAASAWYTWHRSTSNAYTVLDASDAQDTSNTRYYFGDGTNVVAPTSTEFTTQTMNENGFTYVAYLFAHNNNDGGFGPDSDQDIIKCDSYTTSNSGTATITLGFEPQFILRKRVDSSQNWGIFDASRGIYDNNDYILYPNLTNAEAGAGNQYNATGNGFSVHEHAANATYIYMAIRRGPLAAPDDATKVFSQTSFSGNSTDNRIITSGFQTDLVIHKRRSAGAASWFLADRKRGGRGALFLLFTDGAQAQNDYSNYLQEIDLQDGVELGSNGDINGSGSTYINYQWKRAPSFCDITVHTSNGQPTQQIPHNLGVVPEMVWIKSISDSNNWFVHHKDLTSGKNLLLNSTSAETTSNSTTAAAFNATYWTPGNNGVLSGGGNNVEYVAYLFATVAGVSKVGSYTGNGASSQVIDCGFSSGARFVMIKRSDTSNDWYVWDSVRGIVSGNDARLALNANSAEQSGDDEIDPNSSGFEVPLSGGFNNNGLGPYIFYAIA